MRYRVFLLVFIASLLTGCIGGPVKSANISSYTIVNGKLPPIPTRTRTRLTLLVTTPMAEPGYQSSQMIYIEKPYRLQAFALHRWVSPPAQLLLPIFADRIRALGYFSAVVTSPFSGAANYRVDTNLEVLRQEFLRPISQLRMIVQANVINNLTQEVVGSRRFQVLLNTTANNPYSGVIAANQAAQLIAKRLAQFTVTAVTSADAKHRVQKKTQRSKVMHRQPKPVKQRLKKKLPQPEASAAMRRHSAYDATDLIPPPANF